MRDVWGVHEEGLTQIIKNSPVKHLGITFGPPMLQQAHFSHQFYNNTGLRFSCSFVLARNKNNLKFDQSLQLLVKFICISPMHVHSTSRIATWVGKIHRRATGHVVMTQSTRL